MLLTINGTTISGVNIGSGATFTTQVLPVLNDNRQEYKRFERWQISGRIHPDQSATTELERQQSIVTKAAAIEGAILSGNSNSVTLTDDSGATVDSIASARVIQDVSFGGGGRGENAIYRNYSITIERELFGRDTNFVSYRESITYFGGGPRKVITELRSGTPVEFQVSQATPYHAVQTGAAVHRLAPYSNSPYWPANIIDPENRQSTSESKTTDGYGSSWNYQFQSVSPFSIIVPQRPA